MFRKTSPMRFITWSFLCVSSNVFKNCSFTVTRFSMLEKRDLAWTVVRIFFVTRGFWKLWLRFPPHDKVSCKQTNKVRAYLDHQVQVTHILLLSADEFVDNLLTLALHFRKHVVHVCIHRVPPEKGGGSFSFCYTLVRTDCEKKKKKNSRTEDNRCHRTALSFQRLALAARGRVRSLGNGRRDSRRRR